MVQQGIGYTLVPELSVINELNSAHIKRFSQPEPVREVSIVVHNSYIKDSFVDCMKNIIQRILPHRFLEKQAIIELEWN